MTRQEFIASMVRLSDAYGDGFNPPPNTLAAWYDALKNVPMDVFGYALGFIVETEPRWYNANLIALVNRHEPAARQRAESRRESQRINDPARMIPEPRMSLTEAKAKFDEIYKILGQPEILKPITVKGRMGK